MLPEGVLSIAIRAHFWQPQKNERKAELIKYWHQRAVLDRMNIYIVSQKSEPLKHFATATANLHRFKWNFTHTRRHLFLSSTSNFIRIPYSVYEMFNSVKLLSQISVTRTTYFLLTSSGETHDLWLMLFKYSYFSKVKADLYETM